MLKYIFFNEEGGTVSRKRIIHLLLECILFISAALLFINRAGKVDFSTSNSLIIFLVFVPACILIGNMSISLKNTGEIELSDAVIAVVYIILGADSAIFFTGIYAVILMFIREKYITRRNDNFKIFFNTSVYIVSCHAAASFINVFYKGLEVKGLIGNVLYSVTFIGIFIFSNVVMVKLEGYFKLSRSMILGKEGYQLLMVNLIISSFVAVTLIEINSTSGMLGSLLVLGNLLMFHYCFYVYRALKIRNEAIKGLLKITQDIVKYGDFREKCKHLITNMKELIPYTMCAIYTFDLDNDNVTYPIAYDGPEGIGIGDLCLNLSSSALTIQTIREGKIYFSRDLGRDKKIKFTGKFADSISTAIIVPVLIGDKVVGTIIISGNHDLLSFTSKGIDELLNILSNQMALAIENDGIYRDIKNKADVDPLTRLYNRRVLDREIRELIDSKTAFSLVIYDIDDFKKVNDSYGHLAGDEVLKMVSEVIKKSIRKTDVPCRYGGEEIVIIFKDLSKKDACVISERIRSNIELTSTIWSGGNIFVTVSGGVSAFPQDGNTMEDILRIADDILYLQCKKMGKNKVCAYQPLEEAAVSLDHI